MSQQEKNTDKVIARNRKAFHDYEILEKMEAGIELRGTEVKSMRAGNINLADSYAMVENGEIILHHMHISPFEQANRFNHDPYRKRKLLLHKKEIFRLGQDSEKKHLSIIPLSVYFKKQYVKVEIGLGRGRKKYDKRDKISKEENRKNIRNIMRASLKVLLLAAVLFMPASADTWTFEDSGNSHDTVASVVTLRGEYLSLSNLFTYLGFDCSWDSVSGTLACAGKSRGFIFSQDNQFYKAGDSLFQMPVPPVQIGSTLFIAVTVIEKVLVPAGIAIRIDTTAKKISCPDKSEQKIRNTRLVIKTENPESRNILQGSDSKQFQAQGIKTIVIDPGHGGKDPGAVGPGGTFEKDVVLAIGLKLRTMLKADKSLKVYMTRETDVFVPLVKRTAFANNKKADVFISIHANSIQGDKKKRKQVRGFKIYFLSQAKSEEDKLVAMIENSVIELEEGSVKGNYLQNILTDMANSEYQSESENLSIMIAESFLSGVCNQTSQYQGIGQAPFWVLNGAFMPSVLVETAFISNPDEEKMLSDPKYQKRAADAIFKAVLNFKAKYEADL
jgi:SsrA-binding protein